MKKHSDKEIEQAFKVINDSVYQIFAQEAMKGNVAAAKLMAEREKRLKQEKLRKELFGV